MCVSSKHAKGLPLSTSTDIRVVCSNCGAEFAIDEPRCPYCGALNPAGAEKEYMEKLSGIREDTDMLDDAAMDSFKADLKRNTRRTAIVIVVVIAVLASLFFIATCTSRQEDQRALQEFQAREAFRTQHFAELDRLYAAGDDDALSAYVWNQMDDPGFDALWSWEHIDFLEVHDDWEALQVASREFQAGDGSLDDYAWAVKAALHLTQLESGASSFNQLDEEEEQRAAAYRTNAWHFLEDTLQMDREEIAVFASRSEDADGFIEDSKLKQNLEPLLQQLGTLG